MADYAWIGTTSTAFATTTNWLPNGTPTTGDNLIFDHRAQNNLAASDQSATTFASVRITSGFTKLIGTYAAGAITRWQAGITSLTIGEPLGDGSVGSGSQMLAIDLGTVANTTTVYATNSVGQSNGFAPVLLKGVNTSNSITVQSGWVGVGTITLAETFRFTTINVTGPQAIVELGTGWSSGSGVTSTINQKSGVIWIRHNVDTLNQEGGVATSQGAGTMTTANVGGTLVSNSTGTITTLNVESSGFADFSQSAASRTVTNCNVYGGGRLNAETGRSLAVTFSNAISLERGAKSTQINFGPDVDVQQS